MFSTINKKFNFIIAEFFIESESFMDSESVPKIAMLPKFCDNSSSFFSDNAIKSLEIILIDPIDIVINSQKFKQTLKLNISKRKSNRNVGKQL